jgi:Cd2+/Zn2+-exporting ATPase
MLFLAVLCGLGTLAGFLLQTQWPVPATIFFLCAYLCGGWFATIDLASELRRGVFDINLLMIVVAIGAAIIGAWAEGGTLLFLFSLSNALERFANHRTEQTISSLLKSAPETVWRRAETEWVEIPLASLSIGDELLVKPGDLFPTDGEICEGATSADESALTGEALPVSKRPGDKVSGGTVNLEGRAVIRVVRLPQESAVQRIIDLIETARSQKAPAQRFTDSFTRYYTAAVLGGSALFFAWLLFAQREPLTAALYHTMTLLVVASPCALVLSIPSAILVAIAAGARYGILFRGGVAVETLAGVDHFAFDKTGTLTAGRLRVTEIKTNHGLDENEVLMLATAVAQSSTHPLSRAIVEENDRRGLSKLPVSEVKNVPGSGIRARLNGEEILVGSRKFIAADCASDSDEGESTDAEVWVSRGGPLGVIRLRDELRSATREAVAELKALGEKVVLISGDRTRVAEVIAGQAGIEEVHADLAPNEKLEWIRRWQAAGHKVAMVGDGINDAPSLTAADVGLGMGARGSDAALEQADIVLMHDRIENVPAALQLSRQARQIIRQNLVVSLGMVALLITLALTQRIRLSLGVVGHEGSTVLVVLNGLRLLRFKPARNT